MELEHWFQAAAEAVQEIAHGPLGITGAEWRRLPGNLPPDGLWGAYIPLLSAGCSLQLGLLGTRETCARSAQALLGMPPEEAVESDADIFDALGEITNLVAGGIKVRMAPRGDVTLGVPLALTGRVFPAAGSTSVLGGLRFDTNDLWLVLTGTSRR